MLSDRELLELAAKAAGMNYLIWTPGASPIVPSGHRVDERSNWHPLTDDGDNRRLQVKLRLGLIPLEGGGWDCITWDHDEEVTLATDFDPNRAVVLAAAQMAAQAHPDHKGGGANG
jgi:hypothetical protein